MTSKLILNFESIYKEINMIKNYILKLLTENRKHIYKEILGDNQVQWLIDALLNSKAPFKIIKSELKIIDKDKFVKSLI